MMILKGHNSKKKKLNKSFNAFYFFKTAAVKLRFIAIVQ